MVNELLAFQKEYINETLEALDDVVNVLISLEKLQSQGQSINDKINNLNRTIHTIKGSAGSHGFSFVSTICHQIEDVIQQVEHDGLTSKRCDNLISYVDLIREYFNTVDLSGLEDQHFPELKQKLLGLTSYHITTDHKVLIVEPVKSIHRIYRQALEEYGIQLSFAHNAKDALVRLLEEDFDSLITANQMAILDGLRLTRMVKVGHLSPRKVFLVSSDIKLEDNDSVFNPDCVIAKGKDLVATLKKTYGDFLRDEQWKINRDIEQIFRRPLTKLAFIDDDKSLHRLMSLALKPLNGLSIDFYSDGNDALKKMKESLPQLIILDRMMPEISGAEVLVRLKKDPVMAKIPVILMTASDNDEELRNYVTLCAGLILKPFRSKELMSQILTIWNSL